MLNQTVNFNENQAPAPRQGFLQPVKGGATVAIEGVVGVGRDPANTLCLPDPYVSAFHCQFEKRPHGYFVRDLKSRNGVAVNGIRVIEGELKDGIEIHIGRHGFVFHAGVPDHPDRKRPLSSKNEPWKTTLTSLKSMAQSGLPIFIEGESGTGKEVVSNLIHDLSARADRPFVSVNCSALTESLVESELFGHLKGSFTGATSDRKGAFEVARGGSLFLDEIGDLPLALQPKLLRALENSEIRPVGSDKKVTTNVRIITATHKNLEKLVAEGRFRADLYFRIHVLKVSIPALRDRMEDFEDLLYQFCREMRVSFSVPAIETLKKHCWPGNVRELKNTVARAAALYPRMQILPEHLKAIVTESLAAPESHSQGSRFPGETGPGRVSLLKEVEREMIRTRLAANGGNQRRTAAELGMPKSTLHDRIKAYNIEVKSLF